MATDISLTILIISLHEVFTEVQ